MTSADPLATLGLDSIAVKPRETDLATAASRCDSVTLDWEGRDHLPSAATLRRAARRTSLRITVPVRADGFDPLGRDGGFDRLPEGASLAFVAGHAAYVSERERARAIGPRLEAALDRHPAAWVGTEGIESLVRSLDATRYVLLGPDAPAWIRRGSDNHRRAVALYAPVACTSDEDRILDALGSYAARRGDVADRLGAGVPLDASAAGQARSILRSGVADYALAGSPATIRRRIDTLRDAGVDHVVGYPARGIEALVEAVD